MGMIAVIEKRMLLSRFPTPFTPVYGCSKYTPKTAISATLRHARRDYQLPKLGNASPISFVQ
jgi:hypothetical protein